ncbi:MAG: transporter related [Chthoniobacteraceae bacterium]|nr:transporter related [Chthoniobacteraceae bacterium]
MSNDPSSRPVLELDQVRLAFEGEEVLRGVCLRAMQGERLVILGRSGSGKSTLLRLILGIVKLVSGSVKFEGAEVSQMGRGRLNQMRSRIGMVYQYSALISSLNVRDNLALPLEELTDKSTREIEAIVDEKLALVGMADAKNKMPAELSGGMRKRVGFARALVLDPALILYDEPTAGLDPVISAVIDELIITLSEKIEVTSIIVTHEMSSAFKVATRMAMLYEGRIILDDTPGHFRESTDPVVAQFIHGEVDGPILR